MQTYQHALEIVKKLVRHGYIAYFAGGWVRDYVMQHPSEDIDIATNASPEVILDLFPRTLLVGLQFGVVIVIMDGHQYEVSTFRKDIAYLNGRKPEKIEHTGPREDALRRDFTINGMFYDPLEEKLHDFVGGLEDIERKVIRAIGNPYERFFEDRLRMLRAFRFASRFGFTIDHDTQEAIRENVTLLFPAVAMERVWQEFCKMSNFPQFDRALIDMHRLDLLPVIFPELTHLHLKELEKRVEPLKYYPKNSPTALFLQELFPSSSIDELTVLGKYLKISNKELDILAFFIENRPFNISSSRYANALFYAHPHSQLSLNIYAARLDPHEKEVFLKKHQLMQAELAWHVELLKAKKPLVTSFLLKQAGIENGRKMGLLMKAAERIAIENDLRDASSVITQLQKSPLWSLGEA